MGMDAGQGDKGWKIGLGLDAGPRDMEKRDGRDN